MASALQSKTVAFLAAAEGTEQSELISPWETVMAAGGRPVLVSPAEDEIQLFEHLDKAKRMPVDVPVRRAHAEEFAALVLPGGVANPDQLRIDADAVSFVRSFSDAGKPVAAICHAPWTLIDAGVVAGRTLTSWPSLRTDLRNAGATWVDQELVRCINQPSVLVTSRGPQDLPVFCVTMTAVFAEQK